MPEPLMVGWKSIHEVFYTQQGTPIMSLKTFRRKYARELRELGIVFRFNTKLVRRPQMACWESKLRNWWTRKQQQEWKEKRVKEEAQVNVRVQ